jgi:cell division protein FtsX
MRDDLRRRRREPIGISVVVGAMMLVILSHAAHSIFAWLAFAGAFVGLVLINLRYRAVLNAAASPPDANDPAIKGA